jgi:ribosome-binding protein aMBF1 (putative translation factor)
VVPGSLRERKEPERVNTHAPNPNHAHWSDVQRQLGRRLRAARQESGLKVEQVAACAGLEPGDLEAIEAGQIEGQDLLMILRLAACINIDAAQLTSGIA